MYDQNSRAVINVRIVLINDFLPHASPRICLVFLIAHKKIWLHFLCWSSSYPVGYIHGGLKRNYGLQIAEGFIKTNKLKVFESSVCPSPLSTAGRTDRISFGRRWRMRTRAEGHCSGVTWPGVTEAVEKWKSVAATDDDRLTTYDCGPMCMHPSVIVSDICTARRSLTPWNVPTFCRITLGAAWFESERFKFNSEWRRRIFVGGKALQLHPGQLSGRDFSQVTINLQ